MAAGSYKRNRTGQKELFVDFRSSRDSKPRVQSQSRVDRRVLRGQPWTDPEFDLRDAIQGENYDNAIKKGLEWKRPQEIRGRAAQLFTHGRSRYDVGQGQIGTCWFLAAVSTIAEESPLLDKVIPPGEYSLDSPRYDGMFHARFWQFGQWEDVYIDDRLPVIYGNTIWGARSASDKNEMWISLLEKAFAKHHGSYNAVDGGYPGDAFVELTGGVAETVQHKDITDRDGFYARIHNAIKSGCQVISAVPHHFNGVHGLVGGHAYSMSDTAEVKGEKLLRLRNPWGNDREWKGRWSDKDRLWQGIPASKIPHADKGDGEFWISYTDFMAYFYRTAVCSLTPDFDQDGLTDSLDYVLNIYGQWIGSTAAGCDNKLRNPKYLFTLPSSEYFEDSGSAVPLVVQIIIQKREDRIDETKQIRCDLVKIQGGTKDRLVLEYMAVNTNVYNGASQRCFRFRLEAGEYCLVPSTKDAGIEREFLIRVFSSIPLDGVREMKGNRKLISCELKPALNVGGIDYPLSSTRAELGSWRSGVNSGGPITHHQTHAGNPQYHVTISRSGTPVVFRVLQDRDQPPLRIGLWLYSLDVGERIPLTYEQIYAKHQVSKVLVTTDKERSKYIRGFDFDATYMLQKGHFVLLVHTENPGREGDFTLLIKSTKDIRIRAYQNGN